MRIEGQERLAAVFNIFHDGRLSGCRAEDDRLELVVEIPYLAEQVNPTYMRFFLVLEGLTDFRFEPWLNDGGTGAPVVGDADGIAALEPGILSATAERSGVSVLVEVDDHEEYSGATLSLAAGAARVADESGREWSFEELAELSHIYWDNWERQAVAEPSDRTK